MCWEHTTTHHKCQWLRTFLFTHRAHERERVCARACMNKHSLIYGPILFKFAVNILEITTSRMGYLLVMFTHCVHMCECARASARASARVVKTDSLQICWAHTTNDHKLYGLQLGRRARRNHNPQLLTARRLAFIHEFGLFPRNLDAATHNRVYQFQRRSYTILMTLGMIKCWYLLITDWVKVLYQQFPRS
jgi:hypothetical protein